MRAWAEVRKLDGKKKQRKETTIPGWRVRGEGMVGVWGECVEGQGLGDFSEMGRSSQ